MPEHHPAGVPTLAISTEAQGQLYSDNDVTNRVIRVIGEANSQLAIVSPYLDRVLHVEQAILKAKAAGANPVVFARRDGSVIGGNKGKDAVAWFKDEGIEVVGVPRLHAKFYMNEREAVVTSMNLLNSSMLGSLELGFVVEGETHRQLVQYLSTLRIMSESKSESPATTPKNKSRPRVKKSSAPQKKSGGLLGAVVGVVKDVFELHPGHCIRCGDPFSGDDVDAGKTLCAKDYRAWARYKDPNFREKYCASCGQKRKTSYADPYCSECQD
jgi:hypothetical protein